MPFDVPKRLGEAHRTLLGQRNPSWRAWLAWFEIYLALGGPPPGYGVSKVWTQTEQGR